MAQKTVRAERVSSTREAILEAAERLFAEHGVSAVSNRQVGEAAGQGNNTAVSYHFGSKADLVRAIARKRAEQIELLRARMVTEIGESADLRDWVSCFVRPVTEHLAELGAPSWYARFSAQVNTEPAFLEIVAEEFRPSPPLRQVLDGFTECLPGMPAEVVTERGQMARQLMMHTLAERERALAEGAPTFRSSWHDAATGLIDAIVGLWHAPVTPTA